MSELENKINRIQWLKEGFILQKDKDKYILGEGPFSYHRHFVSHSLYQPDFFLTEKSPWIQANRLVKAKRNQLLKFLFKENETGLQNFFHVSQKPSFLLYQRVFFQSLQAFQKDLFQKVVPVFYEIFPLSVKSQLLFFIQNLFRKLSSFSQGYLYGFWNKNSGVLGFTPEILFSLNGKELETMALAGTGIHPGPSLFHDKKELKEHHFVVQSLKESLQKIIRWNGQSSHELLFPPLKHLKTDLKGELMSSFSFEEICRTIHPTAALGGYPRESSLNWLKNQWNFKKKRYFGAPFGFFENHQSAFCLVRLRCLEWDEQKSWIFSGGGLIKESVLQKEWRELSLKREQVKSFFQ